MRKLLTSLAALSALTMHPTAALADSPFKEFSQAWSDRETRYREQHAALDKSAREAMDSYSAAANAHAVDADAKFSAMLTAIQTAAFADGRGMILSDLRQHMVKKPSNVMAELWLQDHTDSLRTEAGAVSSALTTLRARNGSEGPSQALEQDTINGLAANAMLQGKLAELRLLNDNLGSYLRAQSQDDAERRETRARIFGAIGASLSQSSTAPPPTPSWRATCDTFGNQTTCRGN